ncbi:MAG TPA: acyl-CoA dehydrogenase family protein [Nocardioidaceae bacterium]|nr:acyl-CoA dehydrogenase family protein [Nocardioidaceae bacterium]
MRRTIFEPEHDAFRETCRAFCESEIAPHHDEWEAAGIVPRDLWVRAGSLGLLGFDLQEAHGGAGVDDYRFNVVLDEELARAGASGVGIPVHNDIVGPYLRTLATHEQQERWLPGFCAGTAIAAIAMTEPGAGSDLQSMQTTAVRDGAAYVVSGQKTFISNGINADLVIVAAKTDPDAGHRGISLFVVERGMPGFERGRNLDKIGLKAQDTAELFFDRVRVPAENLLGDEGRGFAALMDNLPRERLSIAVGSVAACERILSLTLEYVRERHAFGRPVGRFQANAFTLAELSTEVDVSRAYVDRCIAQHTAGTLGGVDAAKAKWWATELHKRLVDSCLQLFGGYGYMTEYPIAKAFVDARVRTIYGGTTEVMKEIVARSLDL